MFFTQCARCHCTDSQSSAVTSFQPGKRVQSGSTSSTLRYWYGCSNWSSALCSVMADLPASGFSAPLLGGADRWFGPDSDRCDRGGTSIVSRLLCPTGQSCQSTGEYAAQATPRRIPSG